MRCGKGAQWGKNQCETLTPGAPAGVETMIGSSLEGGSLPVTSSELPLSFKVHAPMSSPSSISSLISNNAACRFWLVRGQTDQEKWGQRALTKMFTCFTTKTPPR
jgi:hypothetical protein